jgi:type I restriction enzyme S subunit
MKQSASFSFYPGYQDVLDSWFTSVPSHWRVTSLRGVLKQRNEKNSPIQTTQILSLSIAHGVTLYSDRGRGGNKRKGDLSAYKIARDGDIILNSMNVIVGAVGLSRYTGAISPVYYALYPATDEANIEYFAKVFGSVALQRYLMIYGRGILIKESSSGKFNTIRMKISPDDLKRILLPLPPRPEQDQIVAYLRAQDAHIARYIKAKRDLIALLTEQKLRIIDHAVTRGLDASVQLKPSGIEWLGDVPAHWEIQRLKNVANVVLGKMLTTEAKIGGEFKPYLRSTNVQWVTPEVRDVKEMWIAKSEMAQLRVRRGDLLVSEGGEVGRACMWNEELPECYIQNSVHRVAAKPMMLPEFLFYQFFAYGKRGRFNAIVNRVSIPHLTREKLVTVPFAVPPVEEQQAICRWITNECQPLDDAIARTEEEIKLIREYRDRLITDVVTGQIDVRHWQPSPDDVASAEELAALGDDEATMDEEALTDDAD